VTVTAPPPPPPPPPSTTTTTITGDEPDPSIAGTAITVSFTVTASVGSPAGDVQVTEPNGGSCTATVAEGSCMLTPGGLGERTITASYVGSPTFAPSSGTAQHTVNPQNHAPTANADQGTTAEDTPVNIAVLANDVDPDPNDQGSLSASIVGSVPNGTAVVEQDGTVTYTPNPNFSGTDTFMYSATDPAGASSTAAVSVTVSPVNDSPNFQIGKSRINVNPQDGAQVVEQIATNISAGPGESQAVSFTAAPDRTDILSSGPAIDPNGTLTFTPTADATGDTTVSVTLRDDAGGESAPETFTIEFNGSN
jgi:hypothetical protein